MDSQSMPGSGQATLLNTQIGNFFLIFDLVRESMNIIKKLFFFCFF